MVRGEDMEFVLGMKDSIHDGLKACGVLGEVREGYVR